MWSGRGLGRDGDKVTKVGRSGKDEMRESGEHIPKHNDGSENKESNNFVKVTGE